MCKSEFCIIGLCKELFEQLPLTSKQLISIISSHGWSNLSPYKVNITNPSLIIVYCLPLEKGVLQIIGRGKYSEINMIAGDKSTSNKIISQCLSLEVNIDELYGKFTNSDLDWVKQNEMGRFLRSPSLYEDCCKIILTTNTTWGRTVSMVSNLVEYFGENINGYKAFPLPEDLLNMSENKLKEVSTCGYRANYLQHLSKIAMLSPDVFLDSDWNQLSNKDFYETLKCVKGLGPTSINYLSLIYWKFNGFVIDAYVRRRCREIFHVTENIDEFIKKRYIHYGDLAPMLLWFEITKYWHT